MRRDMAQLLVETPRYDSREYYRLHRRKANRDPEQAVLKQGMRRPYENRKSFGEYFTPLLGFLRANVGRPWDKVFSELNASLHGGGTVIQHTKMHLFNDFVITKPYFIGNKAHFPFSKYSYRGPVPIDRYFYVDLHGILRKAKETPQQRYVPKEPIGRRIDAESFYVQLEDVWYRVWTRELPKAGPGVKAVFDVVLKKWVRCHEHKTTNDWLKRPATVSYRWQVEGDHDTAQLVDLYGTTSSWRTSGRRTWWPSDPVGYAYRKTQVDSKTIRREGLAA